VLFAAMGSWLGAFSAVIWLNQSDLKDGRLKKPIP
jgi:hypothetical protein